LTRLAAAAPPNQTAFDPDDPRLLPPGDHPSIIEAMCRETGQPVPVSRGAMIRCVLESLARRYRDVLQLLSDCAGQPVEILHIVGGGSQNELLNQLTAEATGLPVIAGPVEATVIGNALVQLIALGELKDLREARQLTAGMEGLRRFDP
jgi:sugar (pentulose or hexulose) kinase